MLCAGRACWVKFSRASSRLGRYTSARGSSRTEKQENQDDLIQNGIAEVGGCERPKVGAQYPFSRREVVAVVAQEVQLGGIGCVGRRIPTRGKTILYLLDADLLMMHPAHQPTADVTASRDSRNVVEGAQELGLRQSLQNAEIKGRAADTAARESEADQTFLRGRPVGIFSQAQVAGRFNLRKFLFENFFNRDGTHVCLPKTERRLRERVRVCRTDTTLTSSGSRFRSELSTATRWTKL